MRPSGIEGERPVKGASALLFAALALSLCAAASSADAPPPAAEAPAPLSAPRLGSRLGESMRALLGDYAAGVDGYLLRDISISDDAAAYGFARTRTDRFTVVLRLPSGRPSALRSAHFFIDLRTEGAPLSAREAARKVAERIRSNDREDLWGRPAPARTPWEGWAGGLLALPPLALAAVWGWSWRRRAGLLRPDISTAFLTAATVLLALRAFAEGGTAFFNADAERDWLSALLLVGGEAFPALGPSIHGWGAYLGPFYHLLAALPAAFGPDPRSFAILSFLAQASALWIAGGFLRRASGPAAACALAALWAVSGELRSGMLLLTHDYLPLPLNAALLWVCWDARRGPDHRLLPLAFLLAGLSAQLYAANLPLAALPAACAWLLRKKLSPRDWALCLFAALLPHAVTLLALTGADPLPPLTESARIGSAAGSWGRFLAGAFSSVSPSTLHLLAGAGAAFFAFGLARGLVRRRKPESAEEMIALALLLPLAICALSPIGFRPRFGIVFLPALLMVPALGAAEALRLLGSRPTARTAASAALLILWVVSARPQFPDPSGLRWRTAGGCSRSEGLRWLGKAHALELDAPWLYLMASDAPCPSADAPYTDVYLSTDPAEQAEPGTLVVPLRRGPDGLRAIYYRSSASGGAPLALARTPAGTSRRLDLPYRSAPYAKPFDLLTGRPHAAEELLPRDAPLPLRIEAERRVRSGKRRLGVVLPKGCEATVRRQGALHPLPCGSAPDSEISGCTAPPDALLEVPACRRGLDYLDIFELPVGP